DDDDWIMAGKRIREICIVNDKSTSAFVVYYRPIKLCIEQKVYKTKHCSRVEKKKREKEIDEALAALIRECFNIN
ncbi:MAG: hypothetical protein IJ736_09640, partial [Firmicutes bacterium]|nr:hypothetical protein [Bacillota bacterium]